LESFEGNFPLFQHPNDFGDDPGGFGVGQLDGPVFSIEKETQDLLAGRPPSIALG
jgi:hypothetical protein